jgi:hypothetical protein
LVVGLSGTGRICAPSGAGRVCAATGGNPELAKSATMTDAEMSLCFILCLPDCGNATGKERCIMYDSHPDRFDPVTGYRKAGSFTRENRVSETARRPPSHPFNSPTPP